VVDLLKGGQGVLNIVPLAGVVEEIDAAIHRLEPEVERPPAEPIAGSAAQGG
jgi:hypothetical protein